MIPLSMFNFFACSYYRLGSLCCAAASNIRKVLVLAFVLFPLVLHAQKITLKGRVNDASGELLPFANILVLPDSAFTPSDVNGNFSLQLPPGQKTIRITYTGYQVLLMPVLLLKDTTLTMTLAALEGQLNEVVITAQAQQQRDLVQSTRTGTTTITKEDITGLPSLGGESDVIKTLQLLPGTVRGVEGSSDLFVRGGAADQNLVLLDQAPIYNTSHLFGFLSVFNSDILEEVEAINGGFPAEFGGRLSSILNITSNNTLAERTQVSGDIGLIASRLYVAQPLVKNKASIWLAGRRTYIDQVLRLIGEDLPYYFYDLNGKILLRPTLRDQLSFSYYGGEDILDLFRDGNDDGVGVSSVFASGNTSQSLQWRHQYSSGWESELALIRTSYKYDIRNSFEENELAAFSDIEDYGAKLRFQKDSVWLNGQLTAGAEWTRHSVSPNIINSAGNFAEILPSSSSSGNLVHELAAHAQLVWPLGDRLLVNTGLRVSGALVANKEYVTPEPRFSLRYALEKDQALKLSYSRMAQYMHRISNSAISTPTDIWYPVTDSIQPQRAHQFAAAWQKYVPEQGVLFSAEVYYKSMRNLIGYEEGTNLFFNTDFESKLIQGKGRAYGLELLARKDAGRLSGWLSYTLSWAWRQYNEINAGAWYPSRYDRRHNGAVVVQYKLGKRWAASGVWEFISGSRFTPIIGQYVVLSPTLTGVDLIPVYAEINSVKLADTHRLDLGIKYMSKPGPRFQWNLFAGVNNVYNRASPIGIVIEQDETDNSLRYSQPGLFGLLPFVSFGFRY